MKRAQIVRWVGWFVFFYLMWVVLFNSSEIAGHVVGASVSALAATLVELAVARGEVRPPLWEHGLIFRYAAMVVPAVFRGTAIVFMALFRHLTGSRLVEGQFFAVPVELPSEPHQTAARQTLLTVAIQSVPNTVLVDFDPERQLVLIHVLSPEEDQVASLMRWTAP